MLGNVLEQDHSSSSAQEVRTITCSDLGPIEMMTSHRKIVSVSRSNLLHNGLFLKGLAWNSVKAVQIRSLYFLTRIL